MKRLLRSKANFGILEGFLSELLKRDVKIIEVLESESNKSAMDIKFNRVDILVKLDNNADEIVLVEIQVNSESDYFCRMLFGTAKIITEYMKEGDDYAKVKKIYSVNILYFDLGQGTDYVYHGTTSFSGIHDHDKLNLSKRQKSVYQKDAVYQIYPEYYLIKVDQFNDIAKDTLDEWIYFLKNETIKDSFHAKGIAEAKNKLDSLKLSESEQKEYAKYINDLSLQKSMVVSNYNDGKADGIAISEAKSKEEKITAILSMQRKNISIENIAEIINLSTNEITDILSKNQP